MPDEISKGGSSARGAASEYVCQPLQWARCGYIFALSALACLVLIVLIDRPSGVSFMTPAYDRVSIVHIVFMFGVALFWLSARLIEQSGWFLAQQGGLRCRIFFVSGYAAAAALVMLGLFHDLIYGSSAGFDRELVRVWLEKVEEMKPLLSNSRVGVVYFIELIIMLGPACLYAFWVLKRRGLALFAEPRGAVEGYLIILFVITTVAGLHALRFLPYTVFACIALFLLVWNALRPHLNMMPPLRDVILTMIGMIVLFGGIAIRMLGFGLFVEPVHVVNTTNDREYYEIQSSSQRKKLCDLRDVTPFLNVAFPEPKTFAIDLGFSSELLFRSHHRVVAAPYHRNSESILAIFQILNNPDLKEAYRAVQRSEVDLILVCDEDRGDQSANDPMQERLNLRMRLHKAHPPEWLISVPLPPEVPSVWKFYRVATQPQHHNEGIFDGL